MAATPTTNTPRADTGRGLAKSGSRDPYWDRRDEDRNGR